MKTITITFRRLLFILFSLLFVYSSNAQINNLIDNSSFEENEACPQYSTQEGSGHKLIPSWTYPTAGTTDYFHACGNDLAGVPKNFAGVCPAKEGKGYIGMILMGTKPHVREYAQSEIQGGLNPGEKYCVSFWYRLSNSSKFAVGEIGLAFTEMNITDNALLKNSWSAVGLIPAVKNGRDQKTDNADEWQEICGVYTANGRERYIIIGNFRSPANNVAIEIPGNIQNSRGKRYAYYYIDDVKLFSLREDCEACTCAESDLSAEILTSHRTVTVKPKGGKLPYEYEWSTGETTASVRLEEAGKYRYTVIDGNGCAINEEFDFVPPPVTLTVTHKAGYTGGNDGWIDVIPTGGKLPYKYRWDTGQKTEDLKDLWEGTYVYTVTDANGDEASGTIIFKDKFKQELEQVEEGGKITLKNIFFDFDKTVLLPKSFVELDKLFEFVQEQNIRKVEISGHTDSKGNDLYNQKLSEARAKAVVDYLTSRGVEKERLTSIGYGESQPIDTNNTDGGRANNRRVEFKILKK